MEYEISIIIPTYNAEDYIFDAVESVKNQTLEFNNIELILVDDNSTDNTNSIIKKLSEEYDNIKSIFLTENSGSPSKPRNIGIKESSASYVMFLDNDDTYCVDFCEKMLDTIQKYDADLVTCRKYDWINGELSEYKSVLDKKEDFIELNSIEDDETLLSPNSMFIWDKIYKKDILIENYIEFPIGALYEDVYFNLQYYLNANKIIYLNDYYGYNYNIRVDGDNKSTSQDFKKENLEKFYNGLKNIFKLLDEKNKYFSYFEAEILMGFTKWMILTDCESNYKLKLFSEFKKYYKRYPLFIRIVHIPLFENIVINLGMKFISLSKYNFLILLGLSKYIPFK